jgi:phosphoribosylformylglycinamidine synthase
MAYSGLKGISIFSTVQNWTQFVNLFFSEEPGVVVEISNDDWVEDIRASLISLNIPYKLIGWTKKNLEVSFEIKITESDCVKKYNYPLGYFVESYETLPSQIELKQCNNTQAQLETQFINSMFTNLQNVNSFVYNPVEWNIPNKVLENLKMLQLCDRQQTLINQGSSKTVLIVRDEGSNGDMEMGAFFKLGGFHVLNYNHNKLENDIEILDKVDGIVFVGGFTFSDMMDSATCWATRIKNNHNLFESLTRFFDCKQKFVLGVCNGFQLLIKLGVFGDNIKLVKNDSGRFESRFSKITVDFTEAHRFDLRENPENVFFKNMNFTSYGMWVAHGEGKLVFEEEDKENKFIPILKYADCFLNIDDSDDDDLNSELSYPQNPNGSTNNTAGIISLDGQILGLMPHFERSFLTLQCQYVPPEFSNQNLIYSPWFYISQNLKNFLLGK